MRRSGDLEEQSEQEIFEGKRAAIYTLNQWLWVIITCGMAYVFYWFKSLSTRYHITTQRMIIEEGIFSKTTTILEFIHIHDFRLERPWKMRLLGYGILYITSSHPHLSCVDLYGIKHIHHLYEQVRRAVIAEQTRRRMDWWKEA